MLTLLTLLGAILVSPVDASASTHGGAETRVRAIDTPAAAVVAADSITSPAFVGVSGVWLRQLVSATGVATNSADDVAGLESAWVLRVFLTLETGMMEHGNYRCAAEAAEVSGRAA